MAVAEEAVVVVHPEDLSEEIAVVVAATVEALVVVLVAVPAAAVVLPWLAINSRSSWEAFLPDVTNTTFETHSRCTVRYVLKPCLLFRISCIANVRARLQIRDAVVMMDQATGRSKGTSRRI